MNLMNFFSASNSQANPFQQQAPAQGQQPQAPNPADAGFVAQAAGQGSQQQQGQVAQPQGQVPQSGGGSMPPGQQAAQPAPNPLDGFKHLFNNDPKQQVENPNDLLSKPITQADFDALQKQVQDASMYSLNPEVAQKALQGDMQSFQQILNQVAQSAFMQAARFSHGLVETGFQTYQGRLDKVLPTRFQDFQARNVLETENPALQHEAARPVVDAIRQYVVQQMPNATPAQHAKQVAEYLRAIAPQQPQQAQSADPRDPITGAPLRGNQQQAAPNWGNWFAGN